MEKSRFERGKIDLFTMNSQVSPLRYPGGKRKFLPIIAALLKHKNNGPLLFVEPFAGGASVSIGLLEAGLIAQAVINDIDPLVASFWRTVFSKKAAELARRIESTNPTLALWNKLRSDSSNDELDMAYRCLVLNRTSFSGILNHRAGPIGGTFQNGRYLIDCRFNGKRLAERICQLAKLTHKVIWVGNEDYLRLAERIERHVKAKALSSKQVAWYLDPPFFNMGNRLYRHWFSDEDHQNLRTFIEGPIFGRWILSYDFTPQAELMYGKNPGYARIYFDHSYNAATARSKRPKVSEILVSNIVSELREINPDGMAFSLKSKKRIKTFTISFN